MSPEEINYLRSTLSGFGIGALLVAAVAWVFIKHYLSPYLGRKSQNLADKEDIAALTHQVEQVKRQHAEILETVKARNQLRMAAIDRRLQAHQEAFAMLRELVRTAHGPEMRAQVSLCEKWWEANCLYLEPEAREAFSAAYFAANVHQTLLQAGQYHAQWTEEQAAEHVGHVTANWARVLGAMNIMLTAVSLPPLTQAEVSALTPPTETS